MTPGGKDEQHRNEDDQEHALDGDVDGGSCEPPGAAQLACDGPGGRVGPKSRLPRIGRLSDDNRRIQQVSQPPRLGRRQMRQGAFVATAAIDVPGRRLDIEYDGLWGGNDLKFPEGAGHGIERRRRGKVS
jgi:hypothetical protein